MAMRLASALVALSCALGLSVAAAGAQAPTPSQAEAGAPWKVLEGDLGHDRFEHYIELPFDLPAGVTRVTIRFTYDRAQHSVIDLGLRDPQRFRGWGGGAHDHMTLSTEDATQGYLPGPLPAGRWNLILGAPNIRPGARAHYQAQIFIERKPTITEFADAPLVGHPGWYRGDLHMHSGDSDGHCRAQSGKSVSCPVYRVVETAAARGLDFIALTDHNSTAHFNALRELQPAFDKLLLVPGREITTFWGHSNVFGPTDVLDFRMRSPHWDQARRWIDAAHAEGGIVSINHPGAPSGEICMGCGWRVEDLPQGAADAVEVVNGGTMRETGAADSPLQGFAFWDRLLKTGAHVTGIGGSDSHEADRPLTEAGALGMPTTVVYMPDLSVHGLLAGLRSGRVFIDVEGTHDRILDLTARAGTQQAAMGRTLRLRAGDSADLTVEVKGVRSGVLQLIVDGESDGARRVAFAGDASLSLSPWRADGQAHWLRADVRDAQGRLLLMGNPVYIAAAQ
jgi:predicted metal-dependent phosphoesterase TrpH